MSEVKAGSGREIGTSPVIRAPCSVKSEVACRTFIPTYQELPDFFVKSLSTSVFRCYFADQKTDPPPLRRR